jgi:hypothetical protein
MDLLSSRLTPIVDSYDTCEKTEATLCIYHIHPEIITQKLGIIPSSSKIKGILNRMPNGSERLWDMHNWLLSSEDDVSSKDLRKHLDWILDRIIPVSEQFLEFQQFPDVKMNMRCAWWSKYGDGGPTIWPEQMERMAKLNLECSLSILFFGKRR